MRTPRAHNFKSIPWLFTDPDEKMEEVDKCVQRISDDSSRVQRYLDISVIVHIYHSVLEKLDIPEKQRGETWKLLESMKVSDAIPSDQWGLDDSPPSRVQLQHHWKAARWLIERDHSSELTKDDIKTVHRLLTMNSTKDGQAFKGGEYSSDGRWGFRKNSDPYIFADPKDVPALVRSAINRYERSRAAFKGSAIGPLISIATRLFYDLITAHPFSDANGRVSRLFLSYAMYRDGFPFFINLSSGEKKNHYYRAIFRAQDTLNDVDEELAELRTLVLFSSHRILANFEKTVPPKRPN